MTVTEMARRNEKSRLLKVYQVAHDRYHVESAEGKICYLVSMVDNRYCCSCGDYTNGIDKDPAYVCKHILAVKNGNGNIIHLETSSPRLDERFIINIKGKDFVLYSGLLDLAHQKGIKSILVEPVQFPTRENRMEAICKATIESGKGELFVEWADANPLNVNKMVAEHILRVAATRSKARALRDFTNIGMTCLEELGELDDADETARTRNRSTRRDAAVIAKHDQNRGGADEPQKPRQEPKVARQSNNPSEGIAPHPETKKDQETVDTPACQVIKPSEAQRKAIEKLAQKRGINEGELSRLFEERFQKSYPTITSDDAKTFIKVLQAA